MALFSIVIPMFNTEDCIGSCLDSILAQTHHDWEAIIVDDGSTDGSAAIVERYCEQHPSRFTLVQQDNCGQYAARQAGYARVQGYRVLSLDSDDLLVPQSLQRIDEIMDEAKVDLLMFNAYRGLDSKRKLLHYPKPLLERTLSGSEKGELYRLLISGDTLNNLPTKASSSGLLQDAAAYNPAHLMRMGEDAVQSADLICRARSIRIVNECLYIYRQRTTSITHSFSLKYFDDLSTLAIAMTERFSGEVPDCERLVSKRYAETFCRFVRLAFDAGILGQHAFKKLTSDEHTEQMLGTELEIPVRWQDRALLKSIRSGNYARVRKVISLERGPRALRRALDSWR